VRRIFLLVPLLYIVAAVLAWLSTIVAFVCFALIPLLYVQTGPPYAPPHLPSRYALSGIDPVAASISLESKYPDRADTLRVYVSDGTRSVLVAI
jgi:hypothetical protein